MSQRYSHCCTVLGRGHETISRSGFMTGLCLSFRYSHMTSYDPRLRDVQWQKNRKKTIRCKCCPVSSLYRFFYRLSSASGHTALILEHLQNYSNAMFSLNSIPAIALVFSCLTDASPISSSNTSPATVKLLKRYNSVVNCDNDLPHKDPDNNLNTQADLIGRATADMAHLADTAWQELDSHGAGSPAFQHYFLERDLDLTKRMFSAIAENNDPTNSPYDFVIDCTRKSQCDSPTKPYAFTDFRPESGGPRTMTICPSFFDAHYANNDGLLPFDPNNNDQKTRWCDSYHSDAITNSYREFVTPGEKSLLLPWTTAPSD